MKLTESDRSKKIEESAALLKAMAHPVRLLILSIINDNNCNVSYLEKAAGLSQSGVSQHLRILRLSGIIEPRREGKEICYKIVNQTAVEIMNLLCKDCNH